MELKDFLSFAQILISSVLIVLVLLQVKGTGFGAALGGQDSPSARAAACNARCTT